MNTTKELPDDPKLPAIAAIREAGVAAAIPMLGLSKGLVELGLCGYTPGSRATFEARAEGRHFAIKAYATDPMPEAELYTALAEIGLAGESGPRVPRLLTCDRNVRMLVLSWLEGTPVNQLVKNGQGQRAGDLAATWLWRAASRPVLLGPPFGPGEVLFRVGLSVARLADADPALGTASERVATALQYTPPRVRRSRLVHGTLYARHILDLGDGPGVIDWQQFGQGPVEVDAGMFLATISRLALRHPDAAEEAARAEETFLARTRGLVDPAALAWYRAASLLYVASRGLKRGPTEEARPLVTEAARWTECTGRDRLGSSGSWWSRTMEGRRAPIEGRIRNS